MKVLHFTVIKGTCGWEVYKGEPDNRGERATYNSFDHSDGVYDYCHCLGKAYGCRAEIHYDLRGSA
jgi:hypothetical protein